ncbi:MAG: N4-(beta-N-acetylglucosaminyl)-L-asparaginase [Myxococcota bacterium]|jgi:N4-(beta-N-acetylglucosaminyl)-L-asparaginase
MTNLTRRKFLQATGASLAAAPFLNAASSLPPTPSIGDHQGIVIASGNGLETVKIAHQLMSSKDMRPVSAAIQGVAVVEADPNDLSVGYGGLPNELGIVQLDSSCMDGPTHNAGSVACIEDIMHPAQVAEIVMDRTDHINLVGKGARQFALDHGFKAQDLLTERAREIWLKWRAKRTDDDRLWPINDTVPADPALADEPRPWGTIHCSALNAAGDVGCCTTTSGLAFKIPGRIGDSPLVGAGMYCDNEIGSAGATGRGEAAIMSCSSMLIVERMRAGDSPEQACLYALKRVAQQAQRASRWQPALYKDGRPNFGLTFYAIRKDGVYGSASMHGKVGSRKFAVADKNGARLENCAIAFA